MALEIKALQDLDCFKFRDSNDLPGKDYQFTTLHMVFGCKQDIQWKVCLVVGGHLVDLLDNNTYSSTVRGISMKMPHVISQSTGLEALCSDIGNVLVNAYTTEKVYTRAGLEVGPKLCGKIVCQSITMATTLNVALRTVGALDARSILLKLYCALREYLDH
eukprot:12719262-Ditylum_brightwellii.AAC.1